MAHSPRPLHFAVGTSLLTATLLTPAIGCKSHHTVNERPPEQPHVNEGPEPQPDADAGSVEPDSPEPPSDDEHVNVGPQDEPDEPQPGPDDGPIVNTRPK